MTGRDVVMITADDLMNVFKFAAQFGGVHIPNLERLAGMGVTFDSAQASTALCNPSRTAVLTGQSPFQTGVHTNGQDWQDYIDPQETFAAMLKAAGVEVSAYGKVVHADPGPAVAGQMFDHYASNDGASAATRDDLTTAQAVERILSEASGDRFIMIGEHDPHVPYVVEQQYLDLYPPGSIIVPEWDGDAIPPELVDWLGIKPGTTPAGLEKDIRGYLANISELDAHVGEIIDAAEASGRETTIVFHSDHGWSMGDHDYTGKFNAWETATNAPLIIATINGPALGTVETPVSLLDLAPTILEMFGLEPGGEMIGQSLAPFLTGEGEYVEHPVFTTMNGVVSIRTGDWRVTEYPSGAVEVFNVADDPLCAINLAGEIPAGQQASLLEQLDAVKAELGVEDIGSMTVYNAGAGDSTYFVLDDASLAGVTDLSGHDRIMTADADMRLPAWAEDLIVMGRQVAVSDDHFVGNAQDNLIQSFRGKDTVYGGAGQDTIEGGEHRDLLRGGDGQDRIEGAEGADTIRGGAGDDCLQGGAGEDVFRFGGLATGRDKILGYEPQDHIILLDVDPGAVSIAEVGDNALITYGEETIVVRDAAGLTLADLEFG